MDAKARFSPKMAFGPRTIMDSDETHLMPLAPGGIHIFPKAVEYC